MKHLRKLATLVAAAGALALAGTAHAQNIATSQHDMTVQLPVAIPGGADNGEICVYCHTPHASQVGVEAPLWNKALPGTTYTTYDSTTIDGTILAVGSVSLACLSCHDGTQGMDSIVNAPGGPT
jgi:hypothetical protein